MISVLIVEDDAFIRDITTIKFNEHAYEVVACGSAEAALTAIDMRSFDVVLLDLDLPDMPGIELLVSIRAHKNGADAKVIVFTNTSDTALKQRVSEMSVLGVFAKSSTLYPELFALIDAVAS